MENVDINKANQCNIEDISDSLSDYLKVIGLTVIIQTILFFEMINF